jgi:hypothetical protein
VKQPMDFAKTPPTTNFTLFILFSQPIYRSIQLDKWKMMTASKIIRISIKAAVEDFSYIEKPTSLIRSKLDYFNSLLCRIFLPLKLSVCNLL